MQTHQKLMIYEEFNQCNHFSKQKLARTPTQKLLLSMILKPFGDALFSYAAMCIPVANFTYIEEFLQNLVCLLYNSMHLCTKYQ